MFTDATRTKLEPAYIGQISTQAIETCSFFGNNALEF